MPEYPAETLARHESLLRDLRAAQTSGAGRTSANDPALVAGVAGGGWVDLGGPSTVALVRAGGRLRVTATGRLVAAAGARMQYGWQLVGPYLDAEATASPEETPAVTIAPLNSGALSVVGGELTGSLTYEHTGLSPGWYLIAARYALSAGTGSAQYRSLLADPL
jgi:hypothetical protein